MSSLRERNSQYAQSINYHYGELRSQLILGPPIDVNYSLDINGCELFVSRVPSNINFEILYPLFAKYGQIYRIRILLESSRLESRGLVYVSYFSARCARNAIYALNNYEIIPGHLMRVELSLDNRRLYIGGIPHCKLRDEIWKELDRRGVKGIVDVIVYRSYTSPWQNRGFAFVEFESHQTAAVVKSVFQDLKLFNKRVTVDWSIPLSKIPDDTMRKSCKLFLRNLPVCVDKDDLTKLVVNLLKPRPILKVYKFKDYAFVHLFSREDAELAFSLLRVHFTGTLVEVEWGKPGRLVTKPWYRNEKIGELAMKKFRGQEGMRHTYHRKQNFTSDTDYITNSMMECNLHGAHGSCRST